MDGLKSVWERATGSRVATIAASLAVIGFGVFLIAAGEVLGWGWTRLVGAGLISTAAVFVGALIGWSDPIRPRVAGVFSSWSQSIILLLTLVMVAPLLAGLLFLFGGLIVSSAGTDWYLILAGVLITVVMLGVTVVTVATAVSLAFQGLWKTSADQSQRSNGRGES